MQNYLSAGQLPGRIYFGPDFINTEKEIQELVDNNISIIWNLLPTPNPKEHKLFYVVQTPTPDFGIPDEEKFGTDLVEVLKYLQEGKNIYVHCLAGRGRTGMAILALKIVAGENEEEAKAEVARVVKGPETEIQTKLAISIHNRLPHLFCR